MNMCKKIQNVFYITKTQCYYVVEKSILEVQYAT